MEFKRMFGVSIREYEMILKTERVKKLLVEKCGELGQ
jgi:hypothetical protein